MGWGGVEGCGVVGGEGGGLGEIKGKNERKKKKDLFFRRSVFFCISKKTDIAAAVGFLRPWRLR